MYQNQKKSTLRRLFDKFVEGVETCLSCAVVGAAIGFGIKAGCNLADAAAETLDDYLDPIDLDDDDDDDEDQDDEVTARYPHLKNNFLSRVIDETEEESGDDENVPEADGVTPASEVEKMVAVTFPARDSKGRFVKKTIVPAPESAEEVEEPAESEEADQEAEASTQPEQTEAPTTEETGEPTAEENQQ